MAQIAISIPDDKMELVEREREATGETQSEFFVRLIDAFAEQQREAEMVVQCKQSYELYPETDGETSRMMKGFMAAQMEVLAEYPWDGEEL